MSIEIWTLTVDDGNSISTTVYPTEEDALQSLADNYDPEGEFGESPDVQKFCDAGLVVYIECHTLELHVSRERFRRALGDDQ